MSENQASSLKRVLLIAGGGRGIGAATARLAAAQGYAVAVNYRSNADAAQALVNELKFSGARAVAIGANAADEADIERMYDETTRALGPVTHFVHSAGITGRNSRLDEASAATIREVLEVNLLGAILCARAAVRRMSTRHGGPGGAIVLLSSIAATVGAANEYVFYAAAKGGVDSLAVGLAREVAREGIRVNCVRPGTTVTEIHEPGRLERVTPGLPLGRPANPEEIADAVLYLLSDGASYVTGSVLNVAGAR